MEQFRELLEEYCSGAEGSPSEFCAKHEQKGDVCHDTRKARSANSERMYQKSVTQTNIAYLFILPTLNENFGNVVAEAMMCECPVITTTNAPWSCLSEDKCGWWIELSVENLVNTLNEAMTLRDDERHELGRLSRQSIIKRYSAESVAKKTIAVYRWILGQGDKPEFVYTV